MKHLILTIIFFLAIFAAFAQHRVTLRTGETYTGKILLRNTEVVVLQVVGGQRYQFPAANVLKVEEIAEKTEKSVEPTANNEITEQRESNVFCLLEVSGGGAAANRKFTLSPSGAVSLVFGTRRIADKPLFAGIGASFMPVVAGKENFLFMPVFVRFKTNTEHRCIVPFALLDAGYAFAFSENYRGGLFAKTAMGVQFPLAADNIFYIGLNASITGFYTALTEQKDNSEYHYSGNTNILAFGLSAGIQF